jgi:glycerophosphoryl diester phosphodiesterase
MKPIVIAHRGASGYVPEHTLAAYALAIAQGADFIEPDLVPTRDGVLVARHDNELSATTDVAARGEFADRRCTKRIDGVDVEGWFTEDFTLAEIRRLHARERLPELRPASAAQDGRHPVPTFAEVLALVAAADRPVGVYPEIKHPTWFAAEGERLDGEAIHFTPGARLIEDLIAAGFTDPARVFVQSFEPAALLELHDVLMPRAGVALPLVQLLGPLQDAAPWDVAWHRARGDELAAIYGRTSPWAGTGDGLDWPPAYGDLVTPPGLRWLRRFAAALGPDRRALLGDAGPPAWFDDARSLGFAVHPYTLRAEFDGADEARRLLALGVQGFFIDQPDVGVAVRDGAAGAADR